MLIVTKKFWRLCTISTKEENVGFFTPLNFARPPYLTMCDAEGLLKHCTMELFQLDVNIFLASFLPSLLSSFFSVPLTTVVFIFTLLIFYNQVKTLTSDVYSFVTASLYNTLNKVMKDWILCFVDRGSLYNLFQMKPTRCTTILSIFISNSVHVSGNYLPIIRELTVSMRHWYFSLCVGGWLVCRPG